MSKHYTQGSLQLEERDGKPPLIKGYAAVFYNGSNETEYEIMRGGVERIFPGAFSRSLQEQQDVRALFNHDPNMVLGRTTTGTLKLKEDSKGLSYEIDPPDTQMARDLIASLKRGDVSGSSFTFSLERRSDSSNKNPWKESGNLMIREIREVKMVHDVGPVTFPAYTGTTAMCRSEDPEEAAKEFLAELERRKKLVEEQFKRIIKNHA